MAVNLGYKKVYRDPLGYPAWHAKRLPVQISPTGVAQTSPEAAAPGSLIGWAFIWTLLGVFAGGMALNLTPCVYSLIPITVSYFGGRTVKGKRELIGHGACYIGGIAIVNSVLGVIAALTGSIMGALLQSPLVIAFIAAILVFLATSLFGFWELRLPSSLTRTASKTHAGYFGSIFMGLTLGIVAAPCIGPFVLGLLTWVASLGQPQLGFLIFFTLSVGLGLPLFFLAIFSGQVEKLPRSGEWMLWVRKLMGWVLLAMAAYFLRPILPKTLGIFLLAGVALAAAIHLGWVDRTKASFRAFGWFQASARVVGLVTATFLLGSWFMRGPGVNWQPYSDEGLADARRSGKPVIVDFYADWCTPCRELDEVTFHNPPIVKKAQRDFVMIKVDLTRKNPTYEALLNRYGVRGVPTVVFLDHEGKERRDLRLVDFLPPDQFLSRMIEVKERTQGILTGKGGIDFEDQRN